MREGQGDEGDEEKADQVEDGQGDHRPPGVALQVGGDGHDGDGGRHGGHEDPTVVDPRIRSQEREQEDQPAERSVRDHQGDEEPTELLSRGDPRERDLRHRERHPEAQGNLRDFSRIGRKPAGDESDHEAAGDHRREGPPGVEHARRDEPPLKSLPHRTLARTAPPRASPAANFWGQLSRSSIQNRRRRGTCEAPRTGSMVEFRISMARRAIPITNDFRTETF